MRITAGKAKGLNVHVPTNVKGLRPAQGIVRLAIFNILGDKVKNAISLDLFAGTGSLGIEALSRGAKSCDFVDISQASVKSIEQNLNHSSFLGRFRVFKGKVNQFLFNHPENKYDLVLLDPPYEITPFDILNNLDTSLKKDGVVIYLHGKGTIFTPFLGKLRVVEERKYGATVVSFITF